ncbi:MAG: hypothetical protein HON04_07990 [Planctomicrobium sp.]|nr:hypothetical protein [Planctomicrobium sp.]
MINSAYDKKVCLERKGVITWTRSRRVISKAVSRPYAGQIQTQLSVK